MGVYKGLSGTLSLGTDSGRITASADSEVLEESDTTLTLIEGHGEVVKLGAALES